MQFTDSHCHLNLLTLSAEEIDLQHLVTQAHAEKIQYILCVSVDLEGLPKVIAIAEKFQEVYATVGLHPGEVVDNEPSVEQLIEWAGHPKVVGIGETGLDYHYEGRNLDVMRERFRRHIQVAKTVKKPLIIHTRAAKEDTLRIMQEEGAHEVKGVMHCFTEDWDMAQKAIDMSFYISFSGVVTFKNAKQVMEVAKKVPLEKMLIETDAPFLTPVPYRGKCENRPQYVRFVAEKIAQIKDISVEEVALKTTKNFIELFLG